ncbi:hypothetical protein BX600DRAFT_505724 [Xylariales sp. PMI_506]|nr:hypothetical protein BX600DRAFT_505724 [Xylariales sp. PMI_506]
MSRHSRRTRRHRDNASETTESSTWDQSDGIDNRSQYPESYNPYQSNIFDDLGVSGLVGSDSHFQAATWTTQLASPVLSLKSLSTDKATHKSLQDVTETSGHQQYPATSPAYPSQAYTYSDDTYNYNDYGLGDVDTNENTAQSQPEPENFDVQGNSSSRERFRERPMPDWVNNIARGRDGLYHCNEDLGSNNGLCTEGFDQRSRLKVHMHSRKGNIFGFISGLFSAITATSRRLSKGTCFVM